MMQLHLYGMRLRPASPGAQPSDFVWFIDGKDMRSEYHDIIVYTRPLRDEEIRAYELDFIDTITVR